MSKDKKKRFKYRANVKEFVDADYKSELSPEELEWYENFENSYYANAVGNKKSVFRELPEEEYEKVKKEIYNQTNAQNRDVYAIARTSKNYLKFIDDENNFIQLEGGLKSSSNTLFNPKQALETFIEEAKDEIENECSRGIEAILHELAYECVKLGATLRKDKVNSSLKRQKRKQEKEDE